MVSENTQPKLADLRRNRNGTWCVTYSVRLLNQEVVRIKRPLDTKRLHVARLRREALMQHLGIGEDPR